MRSGHPSASTLERFMRGEASGTDNQRVVQHLVSGCQACRAVASDFWGLEAAPRTLSSVVKPWGQESRDTPEDYAAVFERVLPRIWSLDAELDVERTGAPRLVRELQGLPQGRRLLLVANSRRFQTWALCELLIEEAFALGPRDPRKSIELAETAKTVAESLDETRYGSALTNDLRARAWAYLGNARRIQSDLRGASSAFDTARVLLSKGTGDVLERAKILDLQASLSAAFRDFVTAQRYLDETIRIYRSAGQDHLLGCALIAKASHLGEEGDADSAIDLLKQGLALVDPEVEPRRALVARHNLILFLHESGRHHQALALVPETKALHEALSNPVDLVRFRWLEGKISLEHGELEGAERAFDQVRQDFSRLEILNDAALASLDLAIVYLHQGRNKEVQQLATDVLGIFRALRIPRETVAALVVFQKAAEMERLGVSLVRELRAHLVEMKHDHGSRPDPSK